MKKSITIILIAISCSTEELPEVASTRVEQVVFTDLFNGENQPAITTLQFQYDGSFIQNVQWNFSFPSLLINYSHIENRIYNVDGKLEFLKSNRNNKKWGVSFTYKSGLKYQAEITRNDSVKSVTTYSDYDGDHPLEVQNIHAVYGVFGVSSNV